MKVLFISEYFWPEEKGGGEISCFNLAKVLVKKNIEVHVLTSYFSGLEKEEIKEGVVVHRRLKTGKDPRKLKDNLKRRSFETSLLKELPKIVEEKKIDLIHCFNISSIVAVKLKDKIKKKFVMHVNSPLPFCPKGTLMYKDKELCNKKCTKKTFLDCYLNSNIIGKMDLSFYMKYNLVAMCVIRKKYEKYQKLMKMFDYYFPISEFMKKRLLKENVGKDKTTVVYNLVDLDKFFKLKQPKNKIPKILYIGEYNKIKGPELLLKALKDIDEKYETNFYGSGVLKNRLGEYVEENKLNVNIHDRAKYNKIPKIIEEHDIVVFPSNWAEALGRVALEGCAAGKTVIASNIAGIPDIIEDGKNGYLFERSEEHTSELQSR